MCPIQQQIMFEVAISRYLKHHGYSDIRLKAVLFDMDGVLFNSMPYHADAWHKVMERRVHELVENLFAKWNERAGNCFRHLQL